MTPVASISVKTGTPRPPVKHKKRGFFGLSVGVSDWLGVAPGIENPRYSLENKVKRRSGKGLQIRA
jgi:hypothetical protein